jgi:hypothetical protein
VSDRGRDAIKQLKARYIRFVDTKQWELWRRLFTEDCHFHGTARDYVDPDAFVAGTRERLHGAISIHHGHMPEIVLQTQTTAIGMWAFFDRVEFQEEREASPNGAYGFIGSGHYEESYRKDDGLRRISFPRITRFKLDGMLEPSQHSLQTCAPLSLGCEAWLPDSMPG